MNGFDAEYPQGDDQDLRVSAAELAALGDGDIAYIRPRQAVDAKVDTDEPFLIFGARGDLLAGANSLEQGLGMIAQNGMTPLYLN